MLRFLALAGLVMCTGAHLCLISPHQRGSMDGLNEGGSPDCFLTEAPCGGRRGAPNIIIRPGLFNVTFQKNLNHFNPKAPGNFTVSLGTEEERPIVLGGLPDTNTSALHLYTIPVHIPDHQQERKHAIIQVTYHTNNHEAPPAFYQCGDVEVIPHQ